MRPQLLRISRVGAVGVSGVLSCQSLIRYHRISSRISRLSNWRATETAAAVRAGRTEQGRFPAGVVIIGKEVGQLVDRALQVVEAAMGVAGRQRWRRMPGQLL